MYIYFHGDCILVLSTTHMGYSRCSTSYNKKITYMDCQCLCKVLVLHHSLQTGLYQGVVGGPLYSLSHFPILPLLNKQAAGAALVQDRIVCENGTRDYKVPCHILYNSRSYDYLYNTIYYLAVHNFTYLAENLACFSNSSRMQNCTFRSAPRKSL